MLRPIVLAGIAAPIAAILIAVAVPPATPARAQGIGNIFSDPVPRPPGNIPRGNQPPPPQEEEEEVPALPQGRVLPRAQPAVAGAGLQHAGPGADPASGAAAGHDRDPAERAAGGGRRNRRSPASIRHCRACRRDSASQRACRRRRRACSRATRSCRSRRRQKIINKKASFSGLDKITGRIINFDEDIGETVQFGALRVKTDACYTRPATEAANTDAFVEVDEITLQGEVKRIFSGWMFAASPGLHGVEHPIYDIWLTDCKGPEQTVVTAAPEAKPAPPPPPPAAQKRPPAPKQARAAAADPAAGAAAAASAAATPAAAAGRPVRDIPLGLSESRAPR